MTSTTARPRYRGTLDIHGAGRLDVLAVGRGHLKLTITDRNPVEIEKARRIIEDMMARRFSIFVEHADGSVSRVKRFDPAAMTYIIDDTMDTIPAAEAPPPPAVPGNLCSACGRTFDKRPGPGKQPGRCPDCVTAKRKAQPPGKRAVPVERARADAVGRTAGG